MQRYHLLMASTIVMMDWDLAEFGVFRITDHIFVGEYPKNATLQRLAELGVTRILNASGCHYQNAALGVTNIPIIDLAEIPLDTAVQLANTIVDCVKNNQRVFVHCVAGQNRSPAAVFLGLIALGYTIEDADKLITIHTQDSNPRHEKLITDRVIRHIQSHLSDGR